MNTTLKCRSAGRYLLKVLTLSLLFAVHQPIAAEDAPVHAVDLLPPDCTLVVQVQVPLLLFQSALTPTGQFMLEPQSLAFLEAPLQNVRQAYGRWQQRWKTLPRMELWTRLPLGEAALGLALKPSTEAAVPPRAVPYVVIQLTDAKAASAALAETLQLLPHHKLPSGLDARGEEGLYFTLQGSWLLAAAELKDLDLLAAQTEGKSPGFGRNPRWLQAQQALGKDALLYAWWDLAAVQEHLMAVPENPEVAEVLPGSAGRLLQALGLDGLRSLSFSLGVKGSRFDFRIASEAPAAAEAPRRGLLKMLEGEGPLPADLLRHVPAQAAWFYATRLDLRRVVPLALQSLDAATGDNLAAGRLAMYLIGLRAMSDVELENDLLANLGDTWVITDTGGGGALMDLMPGLAAVGQAVDPIAFANAAAKLLDFAAKNAPPTLDVKYRTRPVEGVTAHYLSIAFTDLSPALAIKDRTVVFSPTLGGLRRMLKHLAEPAAADIRSNPDFQAAYRTAFAADIPAGEQAALPATLRYLDPRRVRPTQVLATTLAGGLAFGPNLPELLQTQAGLRRTRNQAAMRLLNLALLHHREGDWPATPLELLAGISAEAARITDLSGVRYLSGLLRADPPATILAYVLEEGRVTGAHAVLRLDGNFESIPAGQARRELAEQAAAFKAAGRNVREISGSTATADAPGRWWMDAWRLHGEERSLLVLDLLKLARSFDFALLPDVRALEQRLEPGISWTQADAWGITSHTLSSYPLPALDVAGGIMPMGVAALALPEILRGREESYAALAREDLRDLAAAQWIYRLGDWDRDKVHAYAGSLQELAARGLIVTPLADAEPREGAAAIPRRGYCFKLLPRQGEHAPGKAQEYVRDGQWIGGYAVLAWPAQYPRSGRHCYLLGPGGAMYEADFGPLTEATVKALTAFDPDPLLGWRRAD
ncbi:MAG: DUF2950 family protein [Planctomycetes bacterium]|nr:DUF2950 family protein [Planctomycetota bacterium]